MDDQIRKHLDNQDWTVIIKRLTLHAHLRLRFWNLLTERGIKGFSAEDIALEAISAVYSGEWNWDPEKSDILTYLKFHVVNGLISNLARNKEVLTSNHNDDFDLESDFNAEENLSAKMLTELIRETLKEDELLLSVFDKLYSGMKRNEICELLQLTKPDYDNVARRLKSRLLKFKTLALLK